MSDVGHESNLRRPLPVILYVSAVGQVFDSQHQFPGRGGMLQTPHRSLDFPLEIGAAVFITAVEQILLADAVDGGQIPGILQ
jgi:hypothetical protein